MFRRLRKPITSKQTMKIVSLVNKSKKVLAILGLLGILWSSGPMQILNVMANDGDENIIYEEVLEPLTLPNYPTTTDPDFDPSEVAIDFEVEDERTFTSKTFRKIDGTYEMAMYQDIIHYEEDGKLKNIDNRLLFDASTNQYENKDNKFKVKFPKTIDDNKQIKLSMDGYSIDWNILGIDSSDITFDNTEITPNNIKELTHINQSLIYTDVQPNVDVEYIITGSKVKENIILNEYVPNFNLSFEYKLKDLTLEEDEEGNIVFVNDSNEVVFTFEDLYMLDANMNESFDVTFGYVQTSNKEYTITITPDDTWLQTAIYPVKVDPSIFIKDTSSTSINDKYTWGTTGSQPGLNYLKVGKYSLTNTYRSYIELPTDITPTDSIITYAHLRIQPYDNECTVGCNVVAREVMEHVSFTSILGSDDNNIDNDIDGVLDIIDEPMDYQYIHKDNGDYGYYYWDISKQYQNWIFDSRTSGIVELRNENEVSTSYIFFDSTEYSTTTGPVIVLGYQSTTGIYDHWTYNAQSVGVAGESMVSDYTGMLSVVRNEFNFATELQTLNFTLNYNNNERNTNFGFGKGWVSNYSIILSQDSVSGQYYTTDDTGAKVFYKGQTCDSRFGGGYSPNHSCYLAEDGSRNILVLYDDGQGHPSHFIQTLEQFSYYFNTSNGRLEYTYDTTTKLHTNVYYKDANSYLITHILDDAQNKIDVNYFTTSTSLVEYVELELCQEWDTNNDCVSTSYNVVERIEYGYKYMTSYIESVTYKKDYNHDGTFTVDLVATYDYDGNGRMIKAESSDGTKLTYTYETGNDRINTISSFENGYTTGSLDYTYEYRNTIITNHKGDYASYIFDSYGHTVQITDSDGFNQSYKYMNIFTPSDYYDGSLGDN